MMSLVLSKLDYGNALLSSLSIDQLYKVQKVENHATEVIFKKEKNDHAMSLLRSLHWSPVKERIDYKMCTISFKCLNNLVPQYLPKLLHLKHINFTRGLRSINVKTLIFIPRINSKSYDRSHVRNSLP